MNNQYEIAKKLLQSIVILKEQEKDLDVHYANILAALKIDLPLKTNHYQSILHEITKKLAKQQEQYDEFYAHQILQILQALPQNVYMLELQCSISILSSLINLLVKVNQSLIPEIFTLLACITENQEALKIAYPQLFLKTLHCLLQHHRGLIQERALKFLEKVIKFIFQNTEYGCQNFNLQTLTENNNPKFIVQQKVNEEMTTFCKLIFHSPTPKLNKCYSEFLEHLYTMANSGKYLYVSTQIQLIHLYFRFNDGTNIQAFSNMILQMNSHQVSKIYHELEENLEFELKRFHTFQHEINTVETISVIRKTKWLTQIIFEFWTKQQNELHYNELCEKIAKSLIQSIKYEQNQLVISVNVVNNNQNLKQSIINDSNQLDLELIPILNGDKMILLEIEHMLESIKPHLPIFNYIQEKLTKLLDRLIQTVIVDDSKVIKIQINQLLQIASLLFIMNKSGCSIQKNSNLSFFTDLLKKSNLLIFNQNASYNAIFQFQLIKFLHSMYTQIDEEDNMFLQVSYLDYLICQNSSTIPLVCDLSSLYIQQFDVHMHIASIIYRNISKIQESNLQIDQGNSLQCILHIYSKFDGYNQGLDTIYQVLKTIYGVFDKYFLKSDILFTQKYLEFLIMFFKSWINPLVNNELVTILRQIILSITQFFHHSQLHLFAFQCFYHIIPILAKQELKECTQKQLFGMNDEANVAIVDTLGTIFYEQRKSFEFVLTQDNQIDKLYVWMIIKHLLSYNSCSGFFQLKSLQQFLKQYFKLEQEETTNAIKIYEVFLQILIIYYDKHNSNPNIQDLFNQLKPSLQKIQRIGSEKLEILCKQINQIMSK